MGKVGIDGRKVGRKEGDDGRGEKPKGGEREGRVEGLEKP